MEEKNPIQVADRLFGCLEYLAQNGSCALVELATALELNKSTIDRILNSLIHLGYVEQYHSTGRYELTMKLVGLSGLYMKKMNVVEQVKPFLSRLMNDTKETIHFVKRTGNQVVYIHKVESFYNSVQMVSMVGNRLPIYCSGVGKAIACQMSEEELKVLWDSSNIEKRTPFTLTEFSDFQKELELVKERGYALDNEENEMGVRCIAANLPGLCGCNDYAFSISAPINRMSEERIQELSKLLLQTRQEILEKCLLPQEVN